MQPDRFASIETCSGDTRLLRFECKSPSLPISMRLKSTCSWMKFRAVSKISAARPSRVASGVGKRNKARRSPAVFGTNVASFSFVASIAESISILALSTEFLTNSSPSYVPLRSPVETDRKSLTSVLRTT